MVRLNSLESFFTPLSGFRPKSEWPVKVPGR